MRDGHPSGWPLLCALLPCVILSGNTSLLPNKSWPGSIRLYDPHERKILVALSVHISRRGQAAHRPVAYLRPVAPQTWSARFARPTTRAGIFQHSPGEFHAQDFPVLPAGVAAVTF